MPGTTFIKLVPIKSFLKQFNVTRLEQRYVSNTYMKLGPGSKKTIVCDVLYVTDNSPLKASSILFFSVLNVSPVPTYPALGLFL